MGFGGKIKRTQADKHLSDCVRKSAEWKCQRCGNDYKDKPAGLQCSHFISRAHWGSRFDTRQLSLCAYCHQYVEGHPVEHIEIFKRVHGGDNPDEVIEQMVQLAACKGRAQYARANTKAISAHYLGESKRLDEELIKAKEGKTHDLTVYGYIKPPSLSDPGRST